MNIVILCYHRIGGSGVVAYEIGRAMAEERGHTVHFMGLEPPFRLKDDDSGRMQFHKVQVKEYPVFDYQPYDLALASQLSILIKHFRIDVIHSHYALPHAVSALLARDISGKKSVRCVTTLHGTDITVVGAHPGMMDITRYAIEKSDVATAVSNSLVRDSEMVLGVTPGKIKTVYNFVNPKFFNPSLKPGDCENGKNKIIILHVSNLRAVKRPLDVIKIFHGIYKAMEGRRPVELRVVGEGPLQYEMMDEVEKLGLESHVQFLGVRSNIGAVMACCQLLLLPSQQESFGLAALEAMACGVPVAASRVGGLPEVIDDGRSGVLFTVGNTDEAAEKAVKLLKDRELYDAVRLAGIDTALEKFAMNKIVDQYEALYRGDSH
ncbi:MAG: N-acetyl-alpha-D-glucosaminyl L-malate synthase BshA [Candidatus Aminicenantes bacterium]|nr:N-acetyl-alpha-D-glucosaminyl L-malate synthase BshA [Candidatus Aminicenantes bacterium]